MKIFSFKYKCIFLILSLLFLLLVTHGIQAGESISYTISKDKSGKTIATENETGKIVFSAINSAKIINQVIQFFQLRS